MNSKEKLITANYHTHTYRCKHASGTAGEYADAAAEKGLEVLGFSEHTPFPDDRWNDVRMDYRELDDYGREIDSLKVRKDIMILKGMECDWVREYKNYFTDDFRGKRGYEYLIGSIHWFPVNGEWVFSYNSNAAGNLKFYTKHMIEMIEAEIFDFIAHPDLFARFTDKWTEETDICSREICAAAEAYNVPLEINGYGLRKPKMDTADGKRYAYPHPRFWEIASDYKIKVICNSDAHSPEDVDASIDMCREIADSNSLEYADMSYLTGSCKRKKYA